VLYACGAPGMVDAIKSVAARAGAVCYADPFLPTSDDNTTEAGVLARAMGWLSVPTSLQIGVRDRLRSRQDEPMKTFGMAEARVRSHFRS